MTPACTLIELENEFPASDTKSKTRNVCIEKDNTLTSCLILSLKVIQSTLLKIPYVSACSQVQEIPFQNSIESSMSITKLAEKNRLVNLYYFRLL